MYILRVKGYKISKNVHFLSLKIGLVLANSADPDKMPFHVTFHLGLQFFESTISGVTTYVIAWMLQTRSMMPSLIYKASIPLRNFLQISVCQN